MNPQSQAVYNSILTDNKLLPLSSFKSNKFSKYNLFPHAQTLPAFFENNLQSEGRIVKLLKGPQGPLRGFYYQLFKLGFQIEHSPPDYYSIIIKNVIFNPSLASNSTSPTSGKHYNISQYQRIIAQFIKIMQVQVIPNAQLTFSQYPIIDEAMLTILQLIVQKTHRKGDNLTQMMKKLCNLFQITLQIYENCFSFQESDVFLYVESSETFYLAFLSQMAQVESFQKTSESPLDIEQKQQFSSISYNENSSGLRQASSYKDMRLSAGNKGNRPKIVNKNSISKSGNYGSSSFGAYGKNPSMYSDYEDRKLASVIQPHYHEEQDHENEHNRHQKSYQDHQIKHDSLGQMQKNVFDTQHIEKPNDQSMAPEYYYTECNFDSENSTPYKNYKTAIQIKNEINTTNIAKQLYKQQSPNKNYIPIKQQYEQPSILYKTEQILQQNQNNNNNNRNNNNNNKQYYQQKAFDKINIYNNNNINIINKTFEDKTIIYKSINKQSETQIKIDPFSYRNRKQRLSPVLDNLTTFKSIPDDHDKYNDYKELPIISNKSIKNIQKPSLQTTRTQQSNYNNYNNNNNYKYNINIQSPSSNQNQLRTQRTSVKVNDTVFQYQFKSHKYQSHNDKLHINDKPYQNIYKLKYEKEDKLQIPMNFNPQISTFNGLNTLMSYGSWAPSIIQNSTINQDKFISYTHTRQSIDYKYQPFPKITVPLISKAFESTESDINFYKPVDPLPLWKNMIPQSAFQTNYDTKYQQNNFSKNINNTKDETLGTFYRQFSDTKIMQAMTEPYKTNVRKTRKKFKGIRSKNWRGFAQLIS